MLESRSPMLPRLRTRKARGTAQADRRWRFHLAWVECPPLRIEVLEGAQRVSNDGWARGGCDGKGHEADLAEIVAGTELTHWEALRRQDRSGMGGRCEGVLRVATRVEPVATLRHASIRSHRTQTPPLEKTRECTPSSPLQFQLKAVVVWQRFLVSHRNGTAAS